MKVVFHRTIAGSYYVSDAPLKLNRGLAGWYIESIADRHDNEKILSWVDRNRDIFELRFPRLRDVRGYLQVLFELDPPPEYDIIPEDWMSKAKEDDVASHPMSRPGADYILKIPGETPVRILSSPGPGPKDWVVIAKDETGEWFKVKRADTLWEIRSQRTDLLARTGNEGAG